MKEEFDVVILGMGIGFVLCPTWSTAVGSNEYDTCEDNGGKQRAPFNSMYKF